METAKYLCEFFFNDFWHFIMLVVLCLSISPKINNSSNSPIKWITGKDEDKSQNDFRDTESPGIYKYIFRTFEAFRDKKRYHRMGFNIYFIINYWLSN